MNPLFVMQLSEQYLRAVTCAHIWKGRELSLDSLLEILSSTFKEKDSGSLLIELGNAVQNVSESCVDYIVRLMSMRDRILSLSRDEQSPFEESVLTVKFFHTLFTGM